MSLFCRFKNVQFEIAATADPGVFEVSAKLMGVDVEKVELIFQVSYLISSNEPVHEKTNNLGSDQVRHKPACTVTDDG